MRAPLLKVIDLSKQFQIKRRTLHAVSHVSFSIQPGQTLGLAGESGCGKSTLGKMLLRLIEPTTGSIFFQDQDLLSLSRQGLKRIRRHMQIVFQNPYTALDPRQTVEDIIGEALDIHRLAIGQERQKRIQSLLEQVGLQPSHLKQLPREFSGGQRQRINIARALAVDPVFIVCDEPLAALDISIQAQIINLLKQLQKERHLTYLFISHDLSAMRYMADYIAVMYLGQLVEIGPSEALCRSPMHPYTQALLSSIPFPDPNKEKSRPHLLLKGEIPSPFELPKGCPFHTRCPFATSLCRTEPPAWNEVENQHFTACHLH
jgi:oligopeptide/dipeptide ABC transporter ATP-binding protein